MSVYYMLGTHEGRKVLRHLLICAVIVLTGCAAAVAGRYGVKKDVDKFQDEAVRVMMTGGAIDADYLGIVANAAEFNPFVVRSKNGNLLGSGVLFTLEVTEARDWLNIGKGSTATFLLNNGAEKLVAEAASGDIDYSVSAPLGTVYTTHYDRGVFLLSPEDLRKIGEAKTIEVRVMGASSYMDFPRRPNNHVVDSFLPNISASMWKRLHRMPSRVPNPALQPTVQQRRFAPLLSGG